MTEAAPRIPTTQRLLRLLEVLAEAGRPLSAAEIGREMALPKQTAHRLCAVMVEDGFLVHAGGGKRVAPGRRSRVMSERLLRLSPAHIVRRQILNKLSGEIGETINFAAPREEGMVYLDRVETDWPLRVQLPIGTHVPFHATASGKTYLAHLPRRARDAMLRALPMPALTDETCTDPEALAAELDEIAAQGFAVDRGEMLPGLIALAVPVRDDDGAYAASLAFHGPVQRLTVEVAKTHLATMQAAARELTAALA